MPNIRDLLFDQATQQQFIRAFCARLREVADGAQAVHAEHSTEVSAEILDRPYPTPLQHTYLVLFIMAICEDELVAQLTDPPSLVRAYFGREGLRRRLERAVCGTPETQSTPARPSLTPVQIVSAEWMRSVFVPVRSASPFVHLCAAPRWRFGVVAMLCAATRRRPQR